MQSGQLVAGRYRLVERIGSGAMGEVWQAEDTTLQRQVAVKIVDLTRPTDASVASRFRREATATAGLHHPHIVQVFDAGFDDPTEAFLVMELLTGPSLADQLGRLSWPQALELTAETADGLTAAHELGVIHRDIKPGNVMLDRPGGGAKIVDFGIARLTQTSEATLTRPSTALGTAAYMSPEQATGAELTPATDIYSLGCLLFALFTGRPPYVGEHPLAVLQQHVYRTPPLPSDLDPSVPTYCDRLVGQMLAHDPDDRPTAREVAQTCRELAARGGSATAQTSPAPLVDRPSEDSGTKVLPAVDPRDYLSGQTGPDLPARRDVRPRHRWIVAVLLVLIALAAVVVLLLAQGDEGDVGDTATPRGGSSASGTTAQRSTSTSAPASRAPETSAPATSAPPTTAAPTSAPPSSAPATSQPGTSEPPSNQSDGASGTP